MKIVWDLDGVLRDINGYLAKKYGSEYPNTWNFKYDGKSIFECIEEHPEILVEAPPTAYLKVVKDHYISPEIWTSQPESWRSNTMDWIRRNIGREYEVSFLTCEEKEAKLEQCEDTILVEDSPNFKNYDKILLIDRPYNRGVKDVMRIFGTRHLDNMINLTKGA